MVRDFRHPPHGLGSRTGFCCIVMQRTGVEGSGLRFRVRGVQWKGFAPRCCSGLPV